VPTGAHRRFEANRSAREWPLQRPGQRKVTGRTLFQRYLDLANKPMKIVDYWTIFRTALSRMMVSESFNIKNSGAFLMLNR
jgi:hypothetical protein